MKSKTPVGLRIPPLKRIEVKPINGEMEARTCLEDVLSKLARTPSNRLRGMQAVVDRTLIPYEVI